MKRVSVTQLGKLTDDELLDHLSVYDSFLCVVNTRGHASSLDGKWHERRAGKDRGGTFHLSTLMCGQHRSEVIETVRSHLASGTPCRVFSTQLIEAGVDVDFPTVFRALTGIDSIAQAAGRCNREGHQKSGDVFVFEPADVRIRGYLAATAQSTRELLPEFEDLLSLEAVRRYFELHYWRHKDRWDHHHIMELFRWPSRQADGSIRESFQFREAADRFRLIEHASNPVIVPYGDAGRRLCDACMSRAPPDWRIQRRLQRFTVPVYDQIYRKLIGTDVETFHDRFAVLVNPRLYDARLGLRFDGIGIREPESLII